VGSSDTDVVGLEAITGLALAVPGAAPSVAVSFTSV